MPRWTDNLARTIRDRHDDVTLRTRNDARRYMAALLLDGADANTVTDAIELALMYEARLDVKHSAKQRQP